jgi:serine/threonine-protein kinase HipA
LKVGLKNVSNQELMEFYSLEILKQIIGKESVVDCELKITPKGNEYLISKRYDREIINNQIMRIHQEDFCQVLSISHYQKYEYQNGVNSKMIIDFLRKYSSNPLKDINIFVKTLFLNYILLCPDGHGKNYSFLIKKDNFRLAPIYDFCSVAHLTKEQMRGGLNEIAMSIDGVKIFCTIKSANIKRFLQKNNLDINEYKNELLIICKALPNIIEKIFNTYKDKYSSLNLLYYNINKNLLKSIKLFEEELLKL